jgi:DNA-binding transcriptional LysR family regulator
MDIFVFLNLAGDDAAPMTLKICPSIGRIIRHYWASQSGLGEQFMDRFDTMRVFTRVVERRSFTAAAEDMGLSRSTVTDAVKQIEARLGVRLLERTTRHVRPTLDGEAYHLRCLSLIADLEDAESAFCGAKPKGPLRVDMNGTLARNFVLPHLPDFLAEYPDVKLFLSEGDRLVDLVREGIDCVVRVGELRDSDMIARRLTMLDEVTCAAPSYLERHGMPGSIATLDGHRMVGFHSSATGAVLPLEFQVGGELRHVSLPVAITVNSADNYAAMTKLGFGLAQVPRYRVAGELADGALVEVLPQNPPTPSPVSLLYPRNRQLSPRVRVFMDWLTRRFDRDRI